MTKTKKKDTHEEALVTFLRHTKEGKYAKVDVKSIPSGRVKEQRYYPQDGYYHSVR